MSTNHEILSTPEFENAAHDARALQAKYEDIRHRIQGQKEVVQQYATQLDELISAHAWEQADTADDVHQARQECFEAVERYQEEYGLLVAMETAATNAREEVATAGRKVFGIMANIVSVQTGGGDLEALIQA